MWITTFGSILNLLRRSFSLPSLGYADAYADDLSDCFNLHPDALTFFRPSSAPLNADHFLQMTDARQPIRTTIRECPRTLRPCLPIRVNGPCTFVFFGSGCK